MKKLSVVMALVIAIFISGTASAANWVVIDKDDDFITSIDKDSIRRGTDSKQFPQFNRKDGFSAIIKTEIKFKKQNMADMEMIDLVSFYEKDGKRWYRVLDNYGEMNYTRTEKDVLEENVDTDGVVWKDVWKYIVSNLK